MIIQKAVLNDIPQITEIYNHIISTSTAVYMDDPVSIDDRIAWFQQRDEQNYPVLVAKRNNDIMGFASYAGFRSGFNGYKHSVEHSVHIGEKYQGLGVGSALMKELFCLAKQQNKHVMIGGVDAANEASIIFHERLGFTSGAILKQVGRKFDRWLDLLFMQKFID